MATQKRGSTGRKKWPVDPKRQAAKPIVFTFQPEEYEVVRPSRLSEWEALMRDAVGFPPELVKSIAAAGLIYCTSYRNGQPVD